MVVVVVVEVMTGPAVLGLEAINDCDIGVGEGDEVDSLETDTASEFDIGVSAVPAADDDGIGTAGKDAGA